MTLPDGILVGWLGDDFTSAAACLEALEFAGLPAVLFLDLPTPAQLARFAGVRALGIATTARSQSRDWMVAQLPRLFRFLAGTGARVVHYKTCSTLDSAPQTGSIGRAIDIGRQTISPLRPMPFLVAAPVMRRYQAFGHLFASAGAGVYRLDRHPVMTCHPVTPMTEAGVARHLPAQTATAIGLVTVEDLDPAAAFARERARGSSCSRGDRHPPCGDRGRGHLGPCLPGPGDPRPCRPRPHAAGGGAIPRLLRRRHSGGSAPEAG